MITMHANYDIENTFLLWAGLIPLFSKAIIIKAFKLDFKIITTKEGMVRTSYKRFNDGVISFYRNDWPAYIEETSKHRREIYWKNYLEHRDNDLPSEITNYTNDNGSYSKSLKWRQNGRLHRDGAPADIYSENGVVVTQLWYCDGKMHRDGDDPAREQFRNGKRFSASFYKHDLLHRDDGPAEKFDGYESYYQLGRLHNNNGPARITSGGAEFFWQGELVDIVDWCDLTDSLSEDEKLMMMLKYG